MAEECTQWVTIDAGRDRDIVEDVWKLVEQRVQGPCMDQGSSNLLYNSDSSEGAAFRVIRSNPYIRMECRQWERPFDVGVVRESVKV